MACRKGRMESVGGEGEIVNILVTGNMGYVGAPVVRRLRGSFPAAAIYGFDAGYFGGLLTSSDLMPETMLDAQYFGDVRCFPEGILTGIDAVVHLAALSNDPLGKRYEALTHEINCLATLRIAAAAKKSGVRSFIFASSCSTYGYAEDGERDEDSALNPLTAYARSKVNSENGLRELADESFTVTCFRFATACGLSRRLRLDLVLNDFVASAVATGEVVILSDGTPWRPLIHIEDMARAIDWGVRRTGTDSGHFLVLNAGSNTWNYQVKDLAAAVAAAIPGTRVALNPDALPDGRSYRVSFARFRRLAPDFQPCYDLETTIRDLRDGLENIGFADGNFRSSRLVRLKALEQLESAGLLDEQLRWTRMEKGRCPNG